MASLAFVVLGDENNQMGKECIIHTCFGESTGSRSPWRVKWLDTAQARALIGGRKREREKKNPKLFNRAVVDMPKKKYS